MLQTHAASGSLPLLPLPLPLLAAQTKQAADQKIGIPGPSAEVHDDSQLLYSNSVELHWSWCAATLRKKERSSLQSPWIMDGRPRKGEDRGLSNFWLQISNTVILGPKLSFCFEV
jgi:hypothetical protein